VGDSHDRLPRSADADVVRDGDVARTARDAPDAQRSQVGDQRCEGVAATLVNEDNLGRERGAGGDRA
jgi:hypothetical protein